MTSPPRGSERSPDAARFDEEYRALDASLRDYLDQRLAQLAPPDDVPPPRPKSRFAWRVDLYFAVTLILLALIWWRLESLAPAAPEVAGPAPVEAPAAPAEPQIEGGGTAAGEPENGGAPSAVDGDEPAPEAAGEAPPATAEEPPAVVPAPGS